MRTRRNAATAETPSKALLGYELPLPGHWEIPLYTRERRRARRIPTAELRNRQIEYQIKKYAKPDQTPKVMFRPGDRVLTRKPISTKRHFGPSWTGPYIINRKVSNEIYELDREGHIITLHVDQLRPMPPGNRVEEPEPDSDSESDHDPGGESPDEEAEDKPPGENEPKPGPSNPPEAAKETIRRPKRRSRLIIIG
ncbi:hypothetical protein NQ314_017708 [Rhamnusium bicolor]|uniref:Uncharacterized protein n=1 Tax=Rhamnusium bicolor TaxID=1586634 RepID=A0AAV8WTV8_9CUCU|nr:hypothetical protein NQ314_017708 [Rhamnusium bicolor]